jgi:hypothetical protein
MTGIIHETRVVVRKEFPGSRDDIGIQLIPQEL